MTRSDDGAWRKIRARVLREEPVCRVVGCGQPSTTVDHLVPLVAGGPRLERSNLAGMCGHHNSSKGARPLAALVPVSSSTLTGAGEVRCPCTDHGRYDRCGGALAPGQEFCLGCEVFSCPGAES